MNPGSPDLLDPVVVTGVGLVSPLGDGREASWRTLIDGASGVRGDRAECPLPSDGSPRAIQLARAAAGEALADAGDVSSTAPERRGCSVSCSKPILTEPAADFHRPTVGFSPLGPSGAAAAACGTVSPGFFGPLAASPSSGPVLLWPDEVTRAVARGFAAGGPVLNISSACATGLQSVMVAAEWLREGRCDLALAGSAESSLHPLYLSGFRQMGVLSDSGVVRPFDTGRDGFVVGEGAAVFVLERLSSARRRGARVYARLEGWSYAVDGHHAVRFNSDGARIEAALASALSRAGRAPRAVDYVNAHGTATPLNDRLEAAALARLFADQPGLCVSSTKGATGHLLGAAGSVELAFTLLALRDGIVPPTLNLRAPETGRLDFVPGHSRRKDLRAAAALSFGFGGAIAALVAAREDA